MGERPKRRKYRDNPYTLSFIEEKNIYIVSFKDVKGTTHRVEINKDVYKAFDEFELEDLTEMNEYDRHIEHSEVFENSLEKRAINKPISLEDDFVNKSTFNELKEAINKLPEIQKRRIKKYYFDEKTQQQIADEEKVDIRAVQYTLNIALKNLKKILK